MECVEEELKSSFKPEMAEKSANAPVLLEELCAVNGQSGGVCDEFSVDDLLDFSKGDGFIEEDGRTGQEETEDVVLFSAGVSQHQQSSGEKSSSKDGPSLHVADSDVCLPADDVANLEWLSHFVEDSFSGYCLAYPAGNSPEKANFPRPEASFPAKLSLTTPVQTKARTKRTRTGQNRVWSTGSPYLTDSSASSSSSSSSSSFTSNPNPNPNHLFVHNTDSGQTADSLLETKPARREKRKNPVQEPRRCSHCLVQKTPQWRTGPHGAKTLCNACGVRYKSGRLLPEYRPACSPSFSSEVHSNNHRKVLEMRRKKEAEASLPLPVQSF